MDKVTIETAIALKEAGFPQPEFKTEQFWYNAYSGITLVGIDFGEGEFMCHSISSGGSKQMFPVIGKGDIFAPTATDILKESKSIYLSPMQGDCWGVFVIGTKKMVGFNAENPAEAAAEAWLSLNKK